jgi:2-polyprenyl-3-methyl-5-hydroxy-6-metoxy-1,4-benzoquinol methylase
MNRFLKETDKKINKLAGLEIPIEWWSRPYEYAFASDFIKQNEIVLDAGCGIEHPFKFELLNKNCTVHAIDIDENILNIKNDKINFKVLNFKDLTKEYKFNFFDKIFCISVLEHDVDNLQNNLNNFYNVLKPNGLAIITIDYPILNYNYFIECVANSGFEFEGEVNYKISNDVLCGYYMQLKVFTAVLKKPKKKRGD